MNGTKQRALPVGWVRRDRTRKPDFVTRLDYRSAAEAMRDPEALEREPVFRGSDIDAPPDVEALRTDAATLRLHLGELTADEVRIAQAAIRYALAANAHHNRVTGEYKEPVKRKPMTEGQRARLIEQAIKGDASTRGAMDWLIRRVEVWHGANAGIKPRSDYWILDKKK